MSRSGGSLGDNCFDHPDESLELNGSKVKIEVDRASLYYNQSQEMMLMDGKTSKNTTLLQQSISLHNERESVNKKQ